MSTWFIHLLHLYLTHMQSLLSRISSLARYAGLIALGCVSFALSVQAADRTLTLPVATVGVPYSYTFLGDTGFTEPYTWQITTSTVSDILPPGFFVTGSGDRDLLLSGTPTRVGTYQFTVAPFTASGTALPTTLVTLEVRSSGSASVDPSRPRIITGTGARTGMLGVAFSTDPILRVEGGTAPYRWRLVRGGLPPGLRFNEQGMIEGMANEAGMYMFDAEVEDAAGFRASTSVIIVVGAMQSSSTSTTSAPTPSAPSPSTGTPSSPAPMVGSPLSNMSFSDRWNLLNRLGIGANTVVRTDFLDPLMLRPLHYYIGVDGRRHIFQSDAVYYSWYPSLTDQVRVISLADLSSIPVGEPITYHPGERVRFRTDMETYGVGDGRIIMRLPQDYSTASGWTWQRGIEELDETHRVVYHLQDQMAGPSSYDPSAVRSRYSTPNSVLPPS